MHRKVAEQIIAAMRGLDQVFGQVDIAVREIEEEDERRRMLRVLMGVYADAYTYITLPVVSDFPDLNPDSEPPIRPRLNFRPGLPVRRINPGARSSEATVHDECMYLSGVFPEDTSEDITGQTRQVLAKIKALLEKNGSARTNILSAVIFLADMDDYAAMNAVWDDWIVAQASPARSVVKAKLSDPNAKIEIMVVAAL
ncbi:MAG TPA: RidA family protein [Reyranella sp.]|jgi:enamine deaminase RidA (YjgF/YER057c/UK114 family)